MKYYVYLSENKINMLYNQLETEEYEEENTFGFDFKIIKGETTTKSNSNDNIYQKAKSVTYALKNECGDIGQDFPYIQCKMKLNCCYYDYYREKHNMVYWGGMQLIDDTLYVLYMISSMKNMLFVKKEDSPKEVEHYNFTSDYGCLLEFMKSYESGMIYGSDGMDSDRDVAFLLLAKALNVDSENKFLEYNFWARVFRKEFVDIKKYKDVDLYGDKILSMFEGYEYDKICAVYASPLFISL